jgi:WD40 repeat protein
VAHRGALSSLAFSPDGAQLVSGSDDGDISFWDPRTGRNRLTRSLQSEVTAIAFSPDARNSSAHPLPQ